MSTHFTLTKEEQEEFRRCPYVKSCSARMVQFTPAFKRHAVEEYARGIAPRTIFRDAGIPIHLLKQAYPKTTLRKWRTIANTHGGARFDEEHRGKHGVVTLTRWRDCTKAYAAMTDKEKVAFLEAEVEALEYIRTHFQLPPSAHQGAHNSRRRKSATSSAA